MHTPRQGRPLMIGHPGFTPCRDIHPIFADFLCFFFFFTATGKRKQPGTFIAVGAGAAPCCTS